MKSLLCKVAACCNVATIIIMCGVAYADRLDPAAHTLAASIGIVFPVLLLINLAFVVLFTLLGFRYLVVPVAGLALVWPALRVYVPASAATRQAKARLTVVSYNVHCYDGPDASRPQAEVGDSLSEWLRRQKADIVCLQEDIYRRREGHTVPRDVYPYADTLHLSPEVSNSLGLYSRFPIVRRRRIDYPSRSNGSVVYWLRRAPGDTLVVINNHLEATHLSLDARADYKRIVLGRTDRGTARRQTKTIYRRLAESAALRAPQARLVARVADSLARRYRVILCGDFNDQPLSYSRRTVASVLTDCYVEAGRGPGYSYSHNGMYVRIDNIMCGGGLRPVWCGVDRTVPWSDHYPIVCQME